MKVFIDCPYCYKKNCIEIAAVAMIDFEVYQKSKCVHCIKQFIFRVYLDAHGFKMPEENAT